MPQATEDRYSRQVKLKEDFEAECLELRQQVVRQCETETVGDSMRVRQHVERHETSSVRARQCESQIEPDSVRARRSEVEEANVSKDSCNQRRTDGGDVRCGAGPRVAEQARRFSEPDRTTGGSRSTAARRDILSAGAGSRAAAAQGVLTGRAGADWSDL